MDHRVRVGRLRVDSDELEVGVRAKVGAEAGIERVLKRDHDVATSTRCALGW